MGLLGHWLFCKHNTFLPNKTALVLISVALLAGCGDVFRPVANPIPRPGGDPAAAGEAIVLGANVPNDPGGAGATTHINVSGDTVVAIEHVGVNPVHAILAAGNVFIANRDSGTLSAYPISSGPNASVLTITLPSANPMAPDAQPSFLSSTDNVNVYVAQPGRNSVEVVAVSTLAATQEIAVPNPVAIAQLPNGGKIYVAQSNNQVTVIDPATLAVTTTVNVGTSPSAIVASPDGNCVYVANQSSGNISVITTSNDTPTATPITVGAGPVFLRFDPKLQRVYVANTAGVSVIAHATDCNSVLLGPTMPIPNTAGALSVTALADGSRAYAALSNGDVAVIDTGSNTVRKTISAGVPSGKASIGSSADSTKVYVANDGRPGGAAGTGKVFVIRTSNDTVVPAPSTSFMPTGSGSNPQFILMNP